MPERTGTGSYYSTRLRLSSVENLRGSRPPAIYVQEVSALEGSEMSSLEDDHALMKKVFTNLELVPLFNLWMSGESLWDVGLDSMNAVALLVAVEEAFGVQFFDEDVTRDLFNDPATLLARLKRASRP